MRILWLKADLLLPLDKGGRLRTWHLLRHLAERHHITYVSFADASQTSSEIEGMRQVASRVEVVPRSETRKGTTQFYLEAASHLLDPLPYAVAKYRSRAFANKVATLLSEQRFHLVVCDFLPPAINLQGPLPCPAVVFTHNVEAEIWRRHAETKRSLVVRFLYRTQHRRMLRFEGATLARFDGVLAVSDADRETFARLYPQTRGKTTYVIPTGVDTAFFSPAANVPRSRHLVFTGSMDWLPNEDAMLFFCREILPLVRADEPDVTLSIVGRAPTPAVQKLAAERGIAVTGRVDDVRPFVHEAAVYVVPLRIGGGTRLKIFEAMAMGKAIVSTSIGAEGLPVASGTHLMLADGPDDFARAVVHLLRNLEARRALEVQARELVVTEYDWSAVAGSLEKALVELVQTAAGTPLSGPASSRQLDTAQPLLRSAESLQEAP